MLCDASLFTNDVLFCRDNGIKVSETYGRRVLEELSITYRIGKKVLVA